MYLPDVIFVTGTDTDVGKTVATAALAAVFLARGEEVVVVKPVQTGVLRGEVGDVDLVRRLSGVTETHEFTRLKLPMAPRPAARAEHAELPGVEEIADRIAALRRPGRRILVEGAGGIMVELDNNGGTLLEVGEHLPESGAFVVVARSGLGTLNHTALTLAALRERDYSDIGIIIGAWPAEPTHTERDNLNELLSGRGAFRGSRFWGGVPHFGQTLAQYDGGADSVATFRKFAEASLATLP